MIINYTILLFTSFIFISSVALAKPLVTEEIIFYPVKGYNSLQIRNNLNKEGPSYNGEKADALTSWEINWDYQLSENTQECHLSRVKITNHISYLLPKWIGDGNVSLQKKWHHYLTKLAIHEKGHGQNGKQTAIEIEEKLLALAPEANCHLLNKVLKKATQEIIRLHQTWDIQYDVSTGHGKKQGAFFP